MAIRIGDCFLYKGKYYLDSRQNLPKTKEDLLNWNIPIPEGFEVFVEGNWYTFDSTVNLVDTGHFYTRDSEISETIIEVTDRLNETSDNISDLDSNINTTFDTIDNTVSSKIIEVNSRLDEINNTMSSNLINLNDKITTDESTAVSKLENNLNTLEEDINSLNSTITSTYDDLEISLNTKNEDTTDRLNTVSQKFNADFTSSAGEISSLEDEIYISENRSTVIFADKLEDLLKQDTWIIEGVSYVKVGIIVSVINDSNINNGAYVLNSVSYADLSSWSKLSESDATIISSGSSITPNETSIFSAKLADLRYASKTEDEVIEGPWEFEKGLSSKTKICFGTKDKVIGYISNFPNNQLRIFSNHWSLSPEDLDFGSVYLDQSTRQLMISGLSTIPDTDRISINLLSNQSILDETLLNQQISITISDTGEVRDYTWSGYSIIDFIPSRSSYTITPPKISGYNEVENFIGKGSANIDFLYTCEELSLNFTINEVPATQFIKFSVIDRVSGEVINYTTDLNGFKLVKVPLNKSISIIGEDFSSYYKYPEVVVLTEGISRTLNLDYTTLPSTEILINTLITDPDTRIISTPIDNKSEILSKFRRCLVKQAKNGEIVICYLNNNNSNLYHDGSVAKLDGTEGDVMVYFPEYYYNINNQILTPTTVSMYLGERPIEEWEIAAPIVQVPECLVGAYKGHILDNKLRSISDVTPTGLNSIESFKNAAKNLGGGFQIIDFDQHRTIALMLSLKYDSFNIPKYIGSGNDANSLTIIGSTNTKGNRDTLSTEIKTWINGLGLEGVFGGINEFMDGITLDLDSKNWWITDATGITRNIPLLSSSTISTGVSPILNLGLEFDNIYRKYFDIVPVSVGGGSSTSTYYCDVIDIGHTENTPAVLRSSDNSSGGQVFYLKTVNSDTSLVNIGTRLAYRGNITIEDNVDLFKSL